MQGNACGSRFRNQAFTPHDGGRSVRRIAVSVTIVALLFPGIAPATAATIAGTKCPAVGAQMRVQGTNYVCKKVGTKRVWKKVSAPARPTPSPSPTPTGAIGRTDIPDVRPGPISGLKQNETTTFDDSLTIDLGPVSNLTIRWRVNDLVLRFTFDPMKGDNKHANAFSIQLTTRGGSVGYSRAPGTLVTPGATSYEVVLTQSMNIKAMGGFATEFADICVAAMDTVGSSVGPKVCRSDASGRISLGGVG